MKTKLSHFYLFLFKHARGWPLFGFHLRYWLWAAQIKTAPKIVQVTTDDLVRKLKIKLIIC
jgi:hypothetical protein